MTLRGNAMFKGWEYPAGSGIRIRERVNRFRGKDYGISYRVTIAAKNAGQRQFKQFPTREAAEKWAQLQYEGLRADGRRHFTLTPAHREDAATALSILAGTGLSLAEAAHLAKKHHQPGGGHLSVAALLEKMLKEKAGLNLRERSIRDLRSRLGIFAKSFGERLVHQISSTEIKTWLEELRNFSEDGLDDVSARTRKNYLVSLRTFFNYAESKGHLAKGTNPATVLPTPKIDWEVPTILTVPEAHRLLKAAQTEAEGSLLAVVVLGLFAGIRSNELAQLSWSAVDLQEGHVTIDASIAKKRRLRLVELPPNAIAWLKTISNRSGGIAPGKYSARMAALVKAAGFADWRGTHVNAMRHSFGSYHLALHGNSNQTSALLGHKANDQVLFDSYRSLAKPKDAKAYFNLYPTSR